MLSTSAFNALLKTLEEPPKHAIFILATTEPQKIPATILSRCQRFDFQGIGIDDIKNNLNRVIRSEKINVSEDAINLIAEACEGGMRDALSLLDQSISYSTDDIVDINDVTAVSGNILATDILDLIDSCYKNNQDVILETINKIISEGKEIPKIVSDIILFLRDMLMYKSNFGSKSIYKNENFIHLCHTIPNNLIYNWLQELNDVQNNIKFTNQKRAYLELGLLKMSDKEINDFNSLTEKVKELEKKIILLQSNKVINNNESYVKLEKKEYNENDYNNKEFEKNIVVDDSFISVNDISQILYSGNKLLKEKLSNIITNLFSENYNNQLLALYNDGVIGARNDSMAIFVLSDDARCSRLMRSDNYIEFLNMLNNKDANLKGYYCISKNTWNQIMNDFRSKYNKDTNPKPILDNIQILVKKYKPIEEIKDPMLEVAESLFPNNKINIKGE